MAVSNPETTHAARPHLGWVLGLTSTAYFMVVLDSVVVITALPRMQRDLHVGLASLQWTLTAYNIAFAAGIITAAAAGDRFGRRRVFTVGLALFTVASAVCALAPNASELIAARTVQGLGGAIILPLSLTILTTAFPAGATRDDRRHLRRTRRAGRRDGADHRRRGHPGNRLALDLLDQRADRSRRPAARDAAAARKLRRPGAARPARRHTHNRRRRCHCLGPGSREPVGLGERRDRQLPGLRRCPAARLRRLGTARQRADGATAPVSQPCVRGRQRHDLPHDGRDLHRRLPRHPGVPARPRLLASLGRRAPAPLLRHADAHLTDRGRRLRPHRPPAGHGDRALLADRRVCLGRRSEARSRRAGSSWTSPS